MLQPEIQITKSHKQFAFDDYERIMTLREEDRYSAWMKAYRGLHFSIGQDGKDLIYWKQNENEYIYKNAMPIQCLDRKYRLPNKIQRHKRRLIIEFDDKKINSEGAEVKDKVVIRKNLRAVEEKLRSMNAGFIRSTHEGSSDYIWVEFTRDLTSQEAEAFLKWIAPEGSEIDLNFSSDNKRFPVLFAQHWKYGTIETPIDYFKGSQIDFDSLLISKIKLKTKSVIHNGYKTAVKEPTTSEPRIKVYGVKDIFKNQIEEKPIIEKLIEDKSVNLMFGESGSLKSILAMGLTCCVAAGKKFLNLKTIRTPVLYLSTENPIRIDSKRFRAVFRGLGINAQRRKPENLPLFLCSREGISTLNDPIYYESLKQTIAERRIKLLVIDTIAPLILDVNDNSAQEIVRVFNNCLFPLVDEFGLSILIIHHSQKTGKDFLGSVKIKASCDSFYEIQRDDNVLHILAHKTRNDAEYNIDSNVSFINKKNKLHKISFEFVRDYYGKQSSSNKHNDLNQKEKAVQLILGELNENELRYGEIVSLCTSQGISEPTAKRTISSLYKSLKIKKKPGENGGYCVS